MARPAASCHSLGEQLHFNPGVKKIVLVGNPNCGKSVFFNAFTGLYVDVSNFPGTTVEITAAPFGQDVIIDTPGVYGISSFNEEERVTRDIVLEADLIINVVNAVHLERDLFLTQQIIDMGIPLVVALNMMDEVERNGLQIDVAALSAELGGVPVVPTVATSGKGFDAVRAAVQQAAVGNTPAGIEALLQQLTAEVPDRRQVLLLLEDDADTAAALGREPGGKREEIYRLRRERVNEIVDRVVQETQPGASWGVILGRWMLRPATGIPLLLLTLGAMYWVLGVFIAGTVVGVTEETIMLGYYEPFIRNLISQLLDPASALGQILIGEFGILTMTVTYVLGLLLPLVLGFYLLLSILEDSGYLPRIAALVDRALTKIGLNGRAIIPMILGFGCVTMATITTRLLGSRRERLIAIALLAITIPCSAQLGVITGLIAPLGARYVTVYLLAIVATFVIVGTLLNKVLPGKSTDLLIDLPPIRLPRMQNVLKKTLNKSYMFILEAAPLFALGALIITLLDLSGALTAIQDVFAPVTVSWLGLPKEASTAFIMGIVRRDFGAAGLADMVLSPAQVTVAMVTITLFVPCIASILVIFKERNWKESLFLWLSSFAIAFLVGGVVAKFIT
ncbi:MAG: ferrous iron transport protein B [Bacillota bacterium]|jgi:ferrous iron transport protein B